MSSRPRFPSMLAYFPAIFLSATAALSLAAPVIPAGAGRQDAAATQDNRAAASQVLGTSTVPFTTSMEVLNGTTKLGRGDRVSFRILEDRHDPIGLLVTDSGEMEVPLIGRVKALNKTCKQLAYELKPLFEKDYFVKATVIIGLDLVGTKARGKVYLTGQVRTPGVMELMPGEDVTVSQAILRAGGLGDFANKREVRVVRKKPGARMPTPAMVKAAQSKKPGWFARNVLGKKEDTTNDSTDTIIVDLVEILEKGHLERDPVLQVGDLVVVPERLINF
jgi:protein involved in polysaccharide export with SLBB domain